MLVGGRAPIIELGRRAQLARIALVAAAVAGVALRVAVYRSALGSPDSDEAVVGLMVRHILHGQLTAFFWGQGYGGSQEALLTAPVFAVFGSGWLALRVVPMLLSGVAALLVWRVGRRTIGEPAASVAGLVLWLWPPFLAYELDHQFGFYASGVVYAALLLLLALRVVEDPRRLRVALFGLVAGLAFWEDIQLVPLIVPAVAWTIWKRPAALRQLWLAAPLAVLGAAPWLGWNVEHRWRSLAVPSDTSTYEHRLRIFFSPLLPMLVGLRAPFTQQPLLGGALTDVVLVLLVAAVAWAAYRTRRRSVSLLFAVLVLFPFVYAISPQTLFEEEPRYVLTLSPVLALLLAWAARTWARGALVLAAAAAISLVTLHRMDAWPKTKSADPQIVPRSIAPLLGVLDRAGIRHVDASYWIAYRLDFESHERVVAAENNLVGVAFRDGRAYATRDPDARWPAYAQAVDADPDHAFVFLAHDADPAKSASQRPAQAALTAHGYRRERVGVFLVYLPPAPA